VNRNGEFVEINYIAGLFDGEGCVGFNIVGCKTGYARGKYYNIKSHLTINLKNSKESKKLFHIMKLVLNRYGIKAKVNEYTKQIHLEIMEYKSVKIFLKLIKPFSLLKREQIKIMINKILPKIKPKKLITRCGERKFTRKQFLYVLQQVDKLNSMKGGRRGTYNTNFFRRLWGFKQKLLVDKREQWNTHLRWKRKKRFSIPPRNEMITSRVKM
jgi:hypothetical protein